MSTALIVFFGLVALILIHELGHFLAAKIFGVRVDEFGIGFPPRLWGRKIGETLYSLNLIPFGGFVRIWGESPLDSPAADSRRSFSRQAPWKRALMLSAGVAFNVVAGWLIISFVFLVGSGSIISVYSVNPNSPAAADIAAGDIILNFSSVPDFIEFIDSHRGQTINLALRRDGRDLSVSVAPRLSPPEGEGALGVSLVDSGLPAASFGSNFLQAALYTASLLAAIFWGLIGIIGNVLSGLSPELIGPVGVFGVAAAVGREGMIFVLHLLAVISLNLAIFNLLPFPALDGGRLIFLLAEKIKGSPLPPRFETYTNALGFALLVLLMVSVTVRDITSLL